MYSPSPRALYKYISYLVDDLEIPSLKDTNDTVDIEAFWQQIELSIMARGLIRGMGTKLFPSLSMLWLIYSGQVEWIVVKVKRYCNGNIYPTPLYSDQSKNPYTVKPSYSFWAPWIGLYCRSGPVYNTEHRKCHRNSPQDLGTDTSHETDEKQATLQKTPSEEDLLEMMHFAQVTLCNMYTYINRPAARFS